MSNELPNSQTDTPDVPTLGATIWRRKGIVGFGAIAGGILAAILAFTAEPVYRAEIVISPARNQSISGSSSIINQLGTLASVAGVNLPSQDGDALEYQAVLQSRSLAESFIRRYQLTSAFSQDGSVPSQWKAVERFRADVLTIREDVRRGVTTIDMDWRDPAVAANWANSYVALANERLRLEAIDTSTKNVSYLNQQISRTSVVELQRVMYGLIENETKTLMLANARADYAFTIIDPAVAPERRISPKRSAMVAIGLIAGLAAGIAAAFLLDELARARMR